MRPRKDGAKNVALRSLTLKVREDLWEEWKILATKERTTMSEIAERLITDYLKKKPKGK